MASRPALDCRDLSASFGADRDVFARVSFSLAEGEVLALFGPNGCGKSTLLRRILGLARGQGELHRDGRVAWVPQRVRESFFPWASLRENLRMLRPAGPAGRAEQDAHVAAAAARLGVEVELSLRPGQVSDGMLQQVAWVRALALRPRVLVADEPFSALDVEARARLGAALRQMAREDGLAALLVLHDLGALSRLADRVLVIEGRPFSTEMALADHHAARWVPNASARLARPGGCDEGEGLAPLVERLLAGGDGG